jgi:hypothetical protein
MLLFIAWRYFVCMSKQIFRGTFLAVTLLVGGAFAQGPTSLQSTFIKIPKASQKASVTQTIALTDVTINYHRPQTLERKVFGGIVPYGQVWRAGANDNTTISFSTDVKIEGQPLAAGVYGLHMIPNENEFTIMFSKNSTSWGSFTYDEKEDALRVKVKPQESYQVNALSYTFENVSNESAEFVLRWAKVGVPVKVSVDRIQTTLDSLHKQMRYTSQYTWEGLNDAATWCLENKTNYDEALKWINTSVQAEERFENLDTKSQLLAAMGKTEEAKAIHDKALEKANAIQFYVYARGLQRNGKADEAFALYKVHMKKFPEHWSSHFSAARVLSHEKNFDGAIKEIKAAIAGLDNNPDQANALKPFIARLEKKEDINN